MPPVHKRFDTTKGLELVIHPDVGSHQKGLRVKYGKGGAHDFASWHPLFFHIPRVRIK